MYELSVDREFCAAHSLRIMGADEPLHGHNFRVRVTLEGNQLDADGLLVDFHELETLLDQVLSPLMNQNLNQTPPFDRVNPSAEHIARHIGVCVSEGLGAISGAGAGRVRVRGVRVTEAPGCSVTYRPA